MKAFLTISLGLLGEILVSLNELFIFAFAVHIAHNVVCGLLRQYNTHSNVPSASKILKPKLPTFSHTWQTANERKLHLLAS